MSVLLESLEVSRATIKRDLTYMRDRLYAPIIWDRKMGGYRFAPDEMEVTSYSLPGVWFISSEIQALLTLEFILRRIQPGVLDPLVQPLRDKIRGILDCDSERAFSELAQRIRIIHGPSPYADPEVFQIVTQAVLGRFQLRSHYVDRKTDTTIPRLLSPQRLVYYNEIWYLDCWCHLRKDLRTFRLANLSRIELTRKRAKEIDQSRLESVMSSGFGIFSGEETQQAVLRFSSRIASWIAKESWHQNQQTEFDEHGRLIMSLPYSNDTELTMRIMKYGPELEVVGPENLRDKIRSMLSETGKLYTE